MRDMLKLGIILMLYTLGAGVLLVIVHMQTAPLIQANKEAATSDEVLAQLLPGMDGGFEKKGADTEFPYWIGYQDAAKTTPGGYLFIAYGKGYSSTIETLVGVDTDLVITGALVIFQQETPGLGDKVQEIKSGAQTPWFTDQFVSKSIDDNLKVTKDGGVIDAISGATVSSRAVTNSIASGLSNMAAVLSGGEIVIEEIVAEEDDQAPFVMPSENDLNEVMPGMNGGFKVTGDGTEFPYWTGFSDQTGRTSGGYVFIARGEGFASTVHILVATDTDGVITGIKTIYQDETPGYGDQVLDIRDNEDKPWFTEQFIGMSLEDEIALTGDGGSIDALTGATITSAAVTSSIVAGLANLADALDGKTFPAWTGKTVTVEASGGRDTDNPDDLMAKLMTGTGGDDDESVSGGPSDDDLTVVLPGMSSFMKESSRGVTYWEGYVNGAHEVLGGYAFIAEGDGFASTIETLVGFNTDGTIIGALVISQGETPGYGDQIQEVREGEDTPWFTRQFKGADVGDKIALTDDGGTIDAVTGATISSRAVTESINTSIKTVMSAITGNTYSTSEESDDDEADDLMARLMSDGDDETADNEPDDLMARLMGGGNDENESSSTDASSDYEYTAVLPGMKSFEQKIADGFTYWIGYTDAANETAGGYAFIVKGDGFASTIETLVGVDTEGTITGALVISQDETPGYGDQVQEIKEDEDIPWFTRQFDGLSAVDDIALSDDNGAIDAISGATISSRAVTLSIAKGYKKLMEAIK